MKVPKFLLADNSDFPEDLFVVHTEYPRFILNVEEEEVEWLDDLEGDDEETMADEATKVVEAAFKWCDEELAKYDEEEDEETTSLRRSDGVYVTLAGKWTIAED